MKQLILFAICIATFGAANAQNTAHKSGTKNAGKARPTNKIAIGGTIKDNHNHPIPDVQAFVYKPDSTIAASGFTDADGHYETNAIMPGKYDLKFVYPSGTNALVTGIPIKKGISIINLSMAAPPADTLILYVELFPKPADKKKPGAKGAQSKSMSSTPPASKPVATSSAPTGNKTTTVVKVAVPVKTAMPGGSAATAVKK